ncbi:MAG: phospholipase D-like domain-containing protein [Clostridia bacterium]
MNTGITVYEFQGNHSMHNKSMLLDGDLSIIGSYNLDMRSTYLDTETMLIIHGEEFAETLEDAMLAMWDQSLKVTPEGDYEAREGVEP